MGQYQFPLKFYGNRYSGDAWDEQQFIIQNKELKIMFLLIPLNADLP